jgi:hypothetical protein
MAAQSEIERNKAVAHAFYQAGVEGAANSSRASGCAPRTAIPRSEKVAPAWIEAISNWGAPLEKPFEYLN